LQVLSHQLAVAGWEDHLPKPRAIWAVVGQLDVAGWEDHLSEPRAIGAMVGVEGCGLIRSNILQRQPTLVLSGCVCREGAEDDDSDSNQHCWEQTYRQVTVDVFHKRALPVILIGVK
jgi:hypothetical protein